MINQAIAVARSSSSNSAAYGMNPESPANLGKIDKRVPVWIPFKADLKKHGPLKL